MENRLEIYKYCFEYWKNNDYNNEVFVVLANKFNIKKDNLKTYIKRYIMIDLDCNEKEEDMYLEYLSEVDTSLILYRKIFGRVEGTVKEQRVNAIEKYCYDKCLEASWTKKELNEIADFLGVTVATIKRYAKKYMLRNNISIDVRNSAINDKMKERSRNSRQNMLMDALCSANTKEEIIKVIEDSGLKNKSLKLAASDYVNLYKKDESEVLLSSLKAKIDIYWHYLSDNHKKEKEEEKIRDLKIKQAEQFNNLEIAKEIVKSFIDSDCKLIMDYVKSISLDIEEFREYVKIIEIYDKELFDEYKKKIEAMKLGRYLYLINELKKIVYLIKNGIEENGRRREFDLLDYYSIIKVDINEVIKFVKDNLSDEDTRVLVLFIKKNRRGRNFTYMDINRYIDSTIEIGSQVNKYGKPIMNTGRIITKEEKKAIIDYLNINKIPINSRTTTLLLRKYLSGNVDLGIGGSKKRIKIKN